MCENGHAWKCLGSSSQGVPGCASPLLLACARCGAEVSIKCGSSRASKCEPCALVYRGRVGRVAGSGVVNGHRGVFVTVTAPTSAVHRFKRVWCDCVAPGLDLAEWNPTASRRMNKLLRDLSRMGGFDYFTYEAVWNDKTGTVGTRRRRHNGLVYFRATELQRRGAIHYHLLVRRFDGAPLELDVELLRELAIKHGFGHEVDVEPLEPGHASYVAKYVAKSSDERSDAPWRGVQRMRAVTRDRLDVATGELTTVVVTPAREWPSSVPTFRTWSASRVWGDSMAVVKAAQQHYVLVVAALGDWGVVEARRLWSRATVPVRPDGVPPDLGVVF